MKVLLQQKLGKMNMLLRKLRKMNTLPHRKLCRE